MTEAELEAHYRRYIQCLNERRLDEMHLFYHDELLYNGARMTRAQWRAQAIEATFAAMPDFQWNIQQIVIQGEWIAVRLIDTGMLAREWLRLRPTGRSVRFGENVFYRFRAGRTDEVWSVFDLLAIKTQLAG
jgi:predicted ester cyclase